MSLCVCSYIRGTSLYYGRYIDERVTRARARDERHVGHFYSNFVVVDRVRAL